MSCDPNGYPWRADRIDPGKVPKAGSPSWNERGDYVTPPMTTPPDDPRADEGLVEAVAKGLYGKLVAPLAQDWEQEGAIVRDLCLTLARAALTAARSHRGM